MESDRGYVLSVSLPGVYLPKPHKCEGANSNTLCTIILLSMINIKSLERHTIYYTDKILLLCGMSEIIICYRFLSRKYRKAKAKHIIILNFQKNL